MSRLAVDASLTLSWLLPDERGNDSHSVQRNFLSAEERWVPAHWKLEVCNALWMAERRKRLNANGIARAVALFSQLPVFIDSETNSRAGSDTLALARQHSVSVYDAAYLELALRRGATLGSLDETLRTVAKKLKVPLLPRA